MDRRRKTVIRKISVGSKSWRTVDAVRFTMYVSFLAETRRLSAQVTQIQKTKTQNTLPARWWGPVAKYTVCWMLKTQRILELFPSDSTSGFEVTTGTILLVLFCMCQVPVHFIQSWYTISSFESPYWRANTDPERCSNDFSYCYVSCQGFTCLIVSQHVIRCCVYL